MQHNTIVYLREMEIQNKLKAEGGQMRWKKGRQKTGVLTRRMTGSQTYKPAAEEQLQAVLPYITGRKLVKHSQLSGE